MSAQEQTIKLMGNADVYSSTIDSTVDDAQQKSMEAVIRCLDNKVLDIYQFLALHDSPNPEDICQGIICIWAQIIGISLIIYEISTTGWPERDACNQDFSPLQILYKMLAFALCVVMSYRGTHLLFNGKGIHKLSEGYTNVFVTRYWAWIGWSVNRLVALGVIGGGYLVIFFSVTTWMMVLNGVAIFALMDLDDKLVNDGHYEKLRKILKKNHSQPMQQESEQTNCEAVSNAISVCCNCIFNNIIFHFCCLSISRRYVIHFSHVICFATSIYVGVCF